MATATTTVNDLQAELADSHAEHIAMNREISTMAGELKTAQAKLRRLNQLERAIREVNAAYGELLEVSDADGSGCVGDVDATDSDNWPKTLGNLDRKLLANAAQYLGNAIDTANGRA